MRIKTDYPGVFYREAERIGGAGMERIYYILFKKDGKVLEEKVGRQYADQLTPAKVAKVRANRIEGRVQSRKEIRDAAKASDDRWTIDKLWNEYEAGKTGVTMSKTLKVDLNRYEKHIKPVLGKKEPHQIIRLDIDRLRINLSKTLKPQTVRHILGLLKRIIHFGAKRQLCSDLPFPMDAIKVDNKTTEDLTQGQLQSLLKAINESDDLEASNIMRMALFTGMRRGELFKLKWTDVDFERGFISIREPKGGVSQKIPLNDQAREVLENYPRLAENVFVRRDGKPFNDIHRRVNTIKEAAGITGYFRSLHGLRHVFASMLASSGEVDMFTLQKLLTHKSPIMTQRYAHLRDETMRKASNLAGNIIKQAAEAKEEQKQTEATT
jgi:integrase